MMVERAWFPAALVLLLALAAPVRASIVHHAPLDQVLAGADWVVVATVDQVEVAEDDVGKRFTWRVKRERILRGDPSLPDLPLMYHHRWPVLRDEAGEVIGTISPIYIGSGLEHDVQAGQAWIFMGKAPASAGAEVLFVDRVEPLEVEAQLLEMMAGPPALAPVEDAGEVAYSPPGTRAGEEGWLVYADAPTWDASNAAGLRPGNASPEAAVVHYLASRVRGDRRFGEVLPPPDAPGGRLTRGLAEHDRWTFLGFRLVARKDREDGSAWVKVWMQISFEGDVDSGQDEFTVHRIDGVWVVTDVPT
jgi:hypothetical protein